MKFSNYSFTNRGTFFWGIRYNSYMGKSEENSKYIPFNYIQIYMNMLLLCITFQQTNVKYGYFDKIYNILMDVVKIFPHFFHKKCKKIVIKDLKLTENHYFTNMDRLDDILGCKIHFFQTSKKFSIKNSAEIWQNISKNTTF